MITIYISNLEQHPGSIQEIRFLNYLAVDRLASLIPIKAWENYKKTFIDTFTKARIILIPRIELLQAKTKTNWILKNPKRLLRKLETVKSYFYILKVKDANLTDLDIHLRKPFMAKTVANTVDSVCILNDYSRLDQYNDIVYGIGSNKFKYYRSGNLYNYLKDLLKRWSKLDHSLQELSVYYVVGTTAVNAKGFKL